MVTINNIIALLLLLLRICFSWHAYDTNKTLPSYCKEFIYNETKSYNYDNLYNTKPLSNNKILKYKLWPNMMSNRDMKSGEIMYGFEYALDKIFQHQFPKDCSNKKFLVSKGFDSGFGSELHVEGEGLVFALNYDRVWIPPMDKTRGPNQIWWANEFCKNNNKKSFDCYFEAATSCDITNITSDITQTFKSNDFMTHPSSLYRNMQDKAISFMFLRKPHGFIPEMFQTFLECSPIRPEMYRYWWRAVSIAFIMRPNKQLLQRFNEHSNDKTLLFDHNKEQCVSVKIRRADKHVETKLIESDTEFFSAAQKVWDNLQNTNKENSFSVEYSSPIMFVESEDPDTMENAISWGARNNWKVMYADIFDKRKDSTTWMNATEKKEAQRSNSYVRPPDEYFEILLTIHYHIRCSGFVGTQIANGCRIIDELRATVGGKADREYVSLRACEEGERPPCYEDTIHAYF